MTGQNKRRRKSRFLTQKYFAGILLFALLVAGMATFFMRSPVTAQVLLDEREPETLTLCQKLEQQLQSVWIKGNNRTQLIPELNRKIAAAKKFYNKLYRKAERRNCYEDSLFFGKSLRKTRRCITLDRKIRQARRDYDELQSEKESLTTSTSRESQREDILARLARHNCGKQYTRHSRRNSSRSWNPFGWDDGESYEPDNGSYGRNRNGTGSMTEEIQPYATYRTMCVRLCDGFYFPISFTALPNKFDKDALQCQDKCAAPARLFVYRNPGAEVEQMIDLQGNPYTSLKNAYKYRKKFVKGCSCKVQEYSLGEANIKAAEDQKKWNTQTQPNNRER